MYAKKRMLLCSCAARNAFMCMDMNLLFCHLLASQIIPQHRSNLHSLLYDGFHRFRAQFFVFALTVLLELAPNLVLSHSQYYWNLHLILCDRTHSITGISTQSCVIAQIELLGFALNFGLSHSRVPPHRSAWPQTGSNILSLQ